MIWGFPWDSLNPIPGVHRHHTRSGGVGEHPPEPFFPIEPGPGSSTLQSGAQRLKVRPCLSAHRLRGSALCK